MKPNTIVFIEKRPPRRYSILRPGHLGVKPVRFEFPAYSSKPGKRLESQPTQGLVECKLYPVIKVGQDLDWRVNIIQ